MKYSFGLPFQSSAHLTTRAKPQNAFRADAYLWWQVAEYGYDTFMIRNRTKL